MTAGVFRTPDDRFADLPGYAFEPHYLEITDLTPEGPGSATAPLRMHYLDEGSGSPIVLFHGEPTWSFLYRRMVAPLAAAGHRVIAPDYFGFGRSDKPTRRDWYSYDRHVESVKRLVEALDLRDATAVVQDWGGPIGLRVATEMDDRFARLVILNTGLWSGRNSMPAAWWAFRDFVERVMPDIPIGLLVARACLTPPSPEVIAGYEAPFPTPDSKWGAAAFPLLVPTAADSPGAAEQEATNERLRNWHKPALVAFSDSDSIFPPDVGQRFAARIPGAQRPATVIENASHFLQEDQGEAVAERIVAFLGEVAPADH